MAAIGAIFWLLPLALFHRSSRWGMVDVFFANFQKMCLCVVVTGYLLIAVKLYEAISIAAACVLLYALRVRGQARSRARVEHKTELSSRLYDFLEGRRTLKSVIASLDLPKIPLISAERDKPDVWERLVACAAMVVFLVSACLRFYHPIFHAALPLSDAYVTLAWMKYMEARVLFHDGLYPHGFHIVLSAIRKVAAIDPVMVLKFVGPFCAVLIVVGVYYFVSRASGSSIAGLTGAFVYGVLPTRLPLAYERQASTNSQEFALLFVLPTGWFVLRYLVGGDRQDLIAATCGLAVVGLVHPVVALFMAAVVFAAYVAGVLDRSVDLGHYGRMSAAGALAATAASLPLLVGYLSGVPFHGSSVQFATTMGAVHAPQLGPFLWAGMILGLAGCTWHILKGTRPRAGPLFALLVIIGGYVIYEAPAFGIQSTALAARSCEFASVACACGFGFGASMFASPASWSGRARSVLVLVVCIMLALTGSVYISPPAKPYTMQSDAAVEQYLRMASLVAPGDWMMVSNEEGYALALGVGWHQMTDDFLARYDPTEETLVALEGPDKGEEPGVPCIFIHQEKNVYVSALAEPSVAKTTMHREEQKPRLLAWLNAYRASHADIRVYYEDDDLVVWLIERPRSPEERFRRIWGIKGR
jgi:hypothetical protein